MAELGFHLPSLIVFLVNFGILLAVLYIFGYKRILAMLDQRSARIQESLSEADQVRQESAQARQELEAQLGSPGGRASRCWKRRGRPQSGTGKRNRSGRGQRQRTFFGGRGRRLSRSATMPSSRCASTSPI